MTKLNRPYTNPYAHAARIRREACAILSGDAGSQVMATAPRKDPFAGIDYTDGDGSLVMPRSSAALRAERGAA